MYDQSVSATTRLDPHVYRAIERVAHSRRYTMAMAIARALSLLMDAWDEPELAAVLTDTTGLGNARKMPVSWRI